MEKLIKKITRYFKTDMKLFIEELNDYRQSLDNDIKILEQNIHVLESALAKHIALGKCLDEKKTSKQMRIGSINRIVIQYVKMGKTAPGKMIREKVKEQQKLQGLDEIIDLHNQRIQEYQYRLQKAIDALDHQKSTREAFLIKQQIAIQELTISEKLDKGNRKKHIERIQREILDQDAYKWLGLKEDVPDDAQIDGEIEKEHSIYRYKYLKGK